MLSRSSFPAFQTTKSKNVELQKMSAPVVIAKDGSVGAQIEEIHPVVVSSNTNSKKHTQKLAYEHPPRVRTVFPPFELEDHPVDQRRRIKAIVTGAGISGVTAGILSPQKVPGLELIIYEKASDVVSEAFPLLR